MIVWWRRWRWRWRENNSFDESKYQHQVTNFNRIIFVFNFFPFLVFYLTPFFPFSFVIFRTGGSFYYEWWLTMTCVKYFFVETNQVLTTSSDEFRSEWIVLCCIVLVVYDSIFLPSVSICQRSLSCFTIFDFRDLTVFRNFNWLVVISSIVKSSSPFTTTIGNIQR